MNIIIVAKPFSTPKVVRLGGWRNLAIAGLCTTSALAVVVAIGALFGTAFAGPVGLRAELAAAQAQLARQESELADARAGVARDIDALALRVGRLQAEAMRLNALGERLARIGKLDDGEFNFREEPALGGPTQKAKPVAPMQAGAVTIALDKLELELSEQSAQLSLLESVLLDRELDQSLLPAGMPVRSGYASSRFGYRTDPFSGKPDFHPGVDFDGLKGSDILAVAGGVISYSGRKAGYGNLVEIDHGNGYRTRYAHNSSNLVQVGDPVRSGQVVARMGATGRATGNHVHFEVWKEGRVVNPSEYIKAIR